MLARITGGRIHYAWFVVGAAFLVMLVTAGVSRVPSVLILPLEQEFGWNRAVVSLAVSISLLLYGLCGPFAAAIMERVGMRRLMSVSLLLIGGAVALTTQLREPWQLYLLWGVAVGLGTGTMASWIGAAVSNRWFVQRRGQVVGLLTASNATGQLVFLPLLAAMVVNFGWRSAVALVAAAALLIIPLVLGIIRNFPQDIGLQPYGAAPDAAEAQPTTQPMAGNPFANAFGMLRQGLGSRDFMLLAGSFFICGASTSGLIGTHLIPASVEHGIPEVTAAGMLATIGIFDLIGTMISGWLSDRYDNRKLLMWYYSLRGLSLLALPFVYGSGFFALALFVVFYGLDWVATVPPTVRIASDLFGKRQGAMAFAWIFTAHQLGAATIAFVAGALRLWLGDYQASFMSAGVLCLIAAGMVIRIGRSPRRDTHVEPSPVPAR